MPRPAHRELRGMRVIVTGGAGTFGTRLREDLLAAGARVVGLDLRGVDAADAPVLACDLTDDESTVAGVEAAVERLGGLDLLINNAGVGGPAPAELPPSDEVRRQIEVNLLASWRASAAAVPHLVAARGRVVFVSSRMAVMPLPLAAAYGVSKRAVVAYADTLRLEIGSHVGVSVVYPSMVASPIHSTTKDAGLSLQGVSRFEPVEGVVAAILRAATARRAPRDVPTTTRGRLEIALARHLPGLTDRIVRRTIVQRVRAGDLNSADLAKGLVERVGRPAG
ncbi:Short-chain dehydrogenase [Paraoerskovia marina]|uniref:Short-chain dehydrogenase n=1 Tax=Paraoerskovia marina TaxID=545619 RepID=A0A1H1MBA1_9CELL|nr:SDR family NAD(P)-dependent oxidoreductase [Paraoerskovia marina]SDR83940.1 Short-chain dehydrogenase [Paraoerskovia marina]